MLPVFPCKLSFGSGFIKILLSKLVVSFGESCPRPLSLRPARPDSVGPRIPGQNSNYRKEVTPPIK